MYCVGASLDHATLYFSSQDLLEQVPVALLLILIAVAHYTSVTF
jgi:hypothetical protein